MTKYLLLILFALLLLPSAAQAQRVYDTATVIACPLDGRGGVCVRFTGRGSVVPVERRYFPTSVDELRRTTTADKGQLNTQDMTKEAVPVGTVLADLAPPDPPDPPDPPVPGPETAFCTAIRRVGHLASLTALGVAIDARLLSDARAAALAAFVDSPAYLTCVPHGVF